MSEQEDLLGELSRVLASLGPALSPPGSEALLSRITEAAKELFGAQACSLALLTDDESELVFTTASGAGADTVVDLRIPANQGIAGWVVMSEQPMSVTDLAQDTRFATDVAQSTGYVPQAILAVPVASPRRLLGVIEVLDRNADRPGAEYDMRLLQLFADQAALAIENVRVFSDLGRAVLGAVAAAAPGGSLADALMAAGDTGEQGDEDLLEMAALFAQLDRLGGRERRLAVDLLQVLVADLGGARATVELKPAWSEAFEPDALNRVRPLLADGPLTKDWAWGGATGAGVDVAVVDSGIEADHPLVGEVTSAVALSYDPTAEDSVRVDDGPHEDLFGHGTACAGIIRRVAPECRLHSVRVLGERLTGKGRVFAAGLDWAIEHRMRVVNLSLSTGREDYYSVFHDLADQAYFAGVMLVCAVNNVPAPSYPSLYSSVFSVAAHERSDPFGFDYNPSPPVELGAPGIDITVAWKGGGTIVTTGNSFAAPHIAGLIARLLSKHPGLTPFQVKTVLHALADNASR